MGGALAGSPLLTGWARAAGATPAEPEVLRSSNGLLDVTLRAAPATVTIGGRECHVLAYNGSFPGPTLVAHPGDLIRIRLVNGLDAQTNLHTHGLHVSGDGNADNVMIHVDPGEEFVYELELPADHHPGTNWYHPHVHGNGAQQIFAGLAGMLVIRQRAELAAGLAGMRERTLVLHATQFTDAGDVPPPLATDQRDHIRLLNGQLNPTIDIAPGETQRWRMVNTAVNTVLKLRLDGHTMTRIAADGNPYRRAVELDTFDLAPGQRADVLVRGGAPGTAVLRTLPYDLGFGVITPEIEIATLACSGPAVSTGEPNLAPLLQPFVDLRRHPVDARREIAMTTAGGFGIDGRPFDPSVVHHVSELGAVEEWTIRNPTGLPHPFHIHVNPFQVTHVDGQPVDAPSYEDTVLVRQNGGSVTFRTRFEDFTGTVVFHCHFVTHSDLGMMAMARVEKSPGSTSAADASMLCRI